MRYLTGGVGQDEAAYLRKAGVGYSLRLIFTGSGWQHLAGVGAHLYDSHGNQRFAAVSDGPLLFIQLPPDRYRFVASADGKEREQMLVVPARVGCPARCAGRPLHSH
ncbi:hypothetical protein SAMN05216345_11847 [Cupriavidus sp. YR651]|nr:hypothetical protein SAMN05216345_11847 [Cupriavidus sp. YR651]